MKATEILKNEHRVIEQVLDCLEVMIDGCEREGRIAEDPARQAIDFLRTFADRCHHGKEEDQLFPMMEARGYSPVAGPTAVMRAEHVQGRAFIQAMESAIPAAACGAWKTAARDYVFLLRQHIDKEDECLFPMADHALLEADQVELTSRFERVEHAEMGPGTHAKYVQLADALADRFGVRKNRAFAGAKQCDCSGHH